jgi:hypothetical protein
MNLRTFFALLGWLALAVAGFAAETPRVLFLVGDAEYKTGETVPAWARAELEPRGVRCTFLVDDFTKPFDQPALLSLVDPDPAKRPAALFISIKRRGLPVAQMEAIAKFAAGGNPVIGIRTASHAFGPKKVEAGERDWVEFDREVLGGDYENHYGKGPATLVEREAKNAGHAVLTGLPAGTMRFASHLYLCRNMAKGTQVLLTGIVEGKPEAREPVAWLYEAKNHRAFYTSLGAPEDFAERAFRRLLRNATLRMAGMEIPGDAGENPGSR